MKRFFVYYFNKNGDSKVRIYRSKTWAAKFLKKHSDGWIKEIN